MKPQRIVSIRKRLKREEWLLKKNIIAIDDNDKHD